MILAKILMCFLVLDFVANCLYIRAKNRYIQALNNYIKEFNADGRYHMILTNTAQDNIIIAAEQYDVTNQVLEALNNRYKK